MPKAVQEMYFCVMGLWGSRVPGLVSQGDALVVHRRVLGEIQPWWIWCESRQLSLNQDSQQGSAAPLRPNVRPRPGSCPRESHQPTTLACRAGQQAAPPAPLSAQDLRNSAPLPSWKAKPPAVTRTRSLQLLSLLAGACQSTMPIPHKNRRLPSAELRDASLSLLPWGSLQVDPY